MPTILDTNVTSELVRERVHPAVLAWWQLQVIQETYTTAVTESEMRRGLAIMPAGRRRNGLSLQTDYLLRVYFETRILPFDSAAAQVYAEIYASRRAMGRRIEQDDCQIAAIARSHDMAIATRNTSDFMDCRIELINPWSTEGTPP